MAQKTHSFIDIAVLEAVRGPFLRGDALALLSEDLGEVLWANGPGAALLRLDDIEAARGAPAHIPFTARRRIEAAPGFPRMDGEHEVAAKLSPGTATDASVSSVALPSGMNAVLLKVPAPAWAEADAPARAISGIAEAGHFAALLDGAGRVLAASEGFAALAIADDELAALARDAAGEADRLAKRRIAAAEGLYPAGIARLSDEPARHMVIIVDDPQQVEAETVAEQPATPRTGPAAKAIDPAAARPDQRDDYDSWYFTDQPPAVTPAQDAAIDGPVPNFEAAEAEAAEGDRPASEPENAPASEAGTDDAVEPTEQQDAEAAAVPEELAAQDTDDTGDLEAAKPDADGDANETADIDPTAGTEQPAEPEQPLFADEPDAVSDAPAPQAAPTAGEVPALTADMADDGLEDSADSEAAVADAGDDTAHEADGPPAPTPDAAFTPDLAGGPVRFVWRTDAQGRFSSLSGEFANAVGPASADIVGQPFREVAQRFGLDPDGEIAGLLERRDTWSGRTVMWPVQDTELRVPVDLAALPVYARDRSFEGFRGFGVARMGDAAADPEAPGQKLRTAGPGSSIPKDQPAQAGETAQAELAQPAEPRAGGDPFRGEAPAISVDNGGPERRDADKVIRLAEHRPAPTERQLSSGEKLAFAEIGARLKEAQEKTAEKAAAGGRAEAGDGSVAIHAETGQEIAASAPQALDAGFAEAEQRETPAGETAAEANMPEPEATAEVQPAGGEDESSGEPRSATETAVIDAPGEAAAGTEPSIEEAKREAAPAEPDSAPLEPEAAAASDEQDADTAEVLEFTPSAFSRPQAHAGIDTSILERLPVPVLIHSGDTLHYANEEFLRLTGYGSVRQLEYSGGLGALFAEEPDEDAANAANAAPAADRRRRLRTRTGDEFPVEALLQSVPWHRGKALLLALRPAAAAASPAAGELAELEARVAEMRAILDTATDGIVMLARDGTIRSISRPAEALFGFDNGTVAGKHFVSLFAVESQRAVRDYLNGLSDHGVASVLNDGREVIGREAMGRFIPLFMTIGRLPGDSGYCAVLRDITQWKRAEDELTRARSEAERASSQKTEFLARISHEIRTPLNAIIGFSELMLDEKFGPIVNERYRDYLRDINRSGNHVLDLVNDLLDISKIEAGEQELSYEAVSLNEALAEAVAMMQPQANRDRVIIRSSYASKLPEIVADLRSVRQIALNLLSNAVRFTQAGGQVIVSTAYEPGGDVVMRVRDTGIGMSQGEIEQALKPFKQINALKRARGDGTGLGLPLTKAMVEANRARFSISSAPGEGTLVEIVFPSTRVLAG